MKIRLVLLLFAIELFTDLNGQQIQPLKVGDYVPEIEFKLLNSNNSKIKLSDLKGKLVILDFWATWCGSCVAGFYKADSLQNIFGEKIQVILVNSSNREMADNVTKINTFYEKWVLTRPEFKLPIAIEDTLAFMLFKHTAIPHCAWIGPDGRVVAITRGVSVTAENIKKFLIGEKLNLPVKDGFYSDALYVDGITPVNVQSIDNYSFFKKGKLEGINPINRQIGQMIEDHFLVNRVVIRNKPLLEIYKRAFTFKKEFPFNYKRICWEVNDLKSFDSVLYTYDLIIPFSESDNLFNIMIGELNRYTDYHAVIEKRTVKCLILQRITKSGKIKTSGKGERIHVSGSDSAKSIGYKKLIFLIDDLESRTAITMPVLDETGYSGNVDLQIKYDGEDIQKLKKELQYYNLDLVEAERLIEMVVIKDKLK